MRHVILSLFTMLVYQAVSALPDTGRSSIDIRRVKLHEDIDFWQQKILETDGRKDDLVYAVRDEDINLLITDLVTRGVNVVQDSIEQSKKLDHRLKVKYLTGLQHMLKNYVSG
jgi:23S rRNA U2552 (ribose-2'-O)-methylase RlmE/FtsJ